MDSDDDLNLDDLWHLFERGQANRLKTDLHGFAENKSITQDKQASGNSGQSFSTCMLRNSLSMQQVTEALEEIDNISEYSTDSDIALEEINSPSPQGASEAEEVIQTNEAEETGQEESLELYLDVGNTDDTGQEDESDTNPLYTPGQDPDFDDDYLGFGILNKQETADLMSTCDICYESSWTFNKKDCCGTCICTTCFKQYIETQMTEGIFEMTCPGVHCSEKIPGGIIMANLDGANTERYKRFIQSKDPNKKKCPFCDWEKEIGDLLLEEEGARTLGLKVTCSGCHQVWCFVCHAPWHSGMTCTDYRNGDRLFKKWTNKTRLGNKNAVKCPSCKVWIEKRDGCNHITCSRCRTAFCYRCRGNWTSNAHLCPTFAGQAASLKLDSLKHALKKPITNLKLKKKRRKLKKHTKVYEKLTFSSYGDDTGTEESEFNKKELSYKEERTLLPMYRDIFQSSKQLYSYKIYS